MGGQSVIQSVSHLVGSQSVISWVVSQSVTQSSDESIDQSITINERVSHQMERESVSQ